MAKYLTPVLILVVAVLAVALAVKGGEIVTGMSVLEVHPSNFTVSGGNVNPTMTTPECYQTSGTQGALGSITLIGNDTVTVVCNTTVSDNNGCADFNGTISGNFLWGLLYQDGAGTSCLPSYLDCYGNATCAAVGACTGGTDQTVECRFLVQWNADNTTGDGWAGFISIMDSGSLQTNDTDTTVDVGALLAIHVAHTLDFGSVPAGTNETNCTHDHNTLNYGNVQIDLQLNGTALDCPSPYTDIPVGYLHYNCTGWNQSYASASAALTGTPVGTYCTGFDLSSSSDETIGPVPTLGVTHWGIGISAGSGGTCWGTIHFTAIAG